MDFRYSPLIIKKGYYLFGNIILIPIVIILLIICPLGRVRFVRLTDQRIGHLAANTELFLRRLRLHVINSKVNYIGIASNKPSNKQLLKMFKRVLPIIQFPSCIYRNIFFETLSNDNSILNKLGLYKELTLNSNEYYEFNNARPTLTFSELEERKGANLLEKMSVDNWFICFHARDSAYIHKSFNSDQNHYQRNSDIRNHLEAARYITEKGGYALRMGAIVEKKILSLKNKRIIDYATNYRTDFGDIYLLTHCKFFLCNEAGLSAVSLIFNVPLAQANIIPMKFCPLKKGDLYIPKKIWSIKDDRFLKFREIIETGVMNYDFPEQYDKAGLSPVENTSKEILDLAIEMNERLDGTWVTTKEDEELQQKFKSLFESDSHCYGFPSNIGAKFLWENKQLLE